MTAAVVLAAYLLGSIPFALILARRWGSDLRAVGSGNLGATNVMRASGVRAGVGAGPHRHGDDEDDRQGDYKERQEVDSKAHNDLSSELPEQRE